MEHNIAEKMTKKMSIALFGFGRMGRIHFQTLLQNQFRMSLTYIVDERPDLVSEELERLGINNGIKICRNDETETVLSDKSLDGIVICVPTERHGHLVKMALNNRKHVMCEKPIALTIAETQECYTLAKEENLVLFCALNRLFDPDYQRIKKQVEDGALGKIQTASTFARDHPEPPQATISGLGSLFSDMGVHSVGVLSWIIGETPESVTAFAHAHNEAYSARGDFDAYGMMMKFPCGAIGYSDCTRVTTYGYDARLEVTLFSPICMHRWDCVFKGHRKPSYTVGIFLDGLFCVSVT